MLRLRHTVLSQFPSPSSASPISQLSRLISAAAPAISTNPSFAVDDYLVTTCGLTRAQALKASTKISHLKSPSNPDAVRAFLASLGLSGGDVETKVKPNVAFLLECGLDDRNIAKLTIAQPWLLTSNPESLRAMVACAQGIGVPCSSRMFRHALKAVAFISQEKITTKVEYLKETFRWSDAEVGIALSRSPAVLGFSSERLQRISEFLISKAGLEPSYIAHRPAMLNYSLEGRTRPRYYVLKYLKENGFLNHDRDYFSALCYSEKVFMEKFICPHKEAAPHLVEDYADACRGEMPTRFRFA